MGGDADVRANVQYVDALRKAAKEAEKEALNRWATDGSPACHSIIDTGSASEGTHAGLA
jgi:hypothetical protein